MVREVSNMKKWYYVLIIAVLTLLNLIQLGWSLLSNRLPWDAIPTEEAALEVGKALLVSVYGEGVLDSGPVTVMYDTKRNAWFVGISLPENYVGGSAAILFRKSDGKILRINNSM